jgi:hypothetical protein
MGVIVASLVALSTTTRRESFTNGLSGSWEWHLSIPTDVAIGSPCVRVTEVGGRWRV